jgi:hypothetical protein
MHIGERPRASKSFAPMARRIDPIRCAFLSPDPDVSSCRRAPRVMTGLARLVHDRQSATAGEDKSHRECDHK